MSKAQKKRTIEGYLHKTEWTEMIFKLNNVTNEHTLACVRSIHSFEPKSQANITYDDLFEPL